MLILILSSFFYSAFMIIISSSTLWTSTSSPNFGTKFNSDGFIFKYSSLFEIITSVLVTLTIFANYSFLSLVSPFWLAVGFPPAKILGCGACSSCLNRYGLVSFNPLITLSSLGLPDSSSSISSKLINLARSSELWASTSFKARRIAFDFVTFARLASLSDL